MRTKVGESIYEASPLEQPPAMPRARTKGAQTALRCTLVHIDLCPSAKWSVASSRAANIYRAWSARSTCLRDGGMRQGCDKNVRESCTAIFSITAMLGKS
jgi:hypothetical protein